MNVGFKIDNCDSKENIEHFHELCSILKDEQPFEIGLECYNPRGFNPISKIMNLIVTTLKEHNNKIVHLTLEAKLLNIKMFTEQEWINIWNSQLILINKLNPKYLIIHATSKESKIYSTMEQIQNICSNFQKLKKILNRPIYIENTYEDLDFYKVLFNVAPIEMNFVLDIGHMKIHSKKTKNDWIEFLKELETDDRKIHFHIHDNDGLSDLHKNISFYKNKETIEFTKELINLFPNFNFILETHESNMRLLKEDLNILN